MDSKQDIHETIVTDEELKHLLTDEKASLKLTSLANALKQKTLAFKIYLFTSSLIVIVYLGATFQAILLSTLPSHKGVIMVIFRSASSIFSW